MGDNRTPTAVLDARGSKHLKYAADRSAEPTCDRPLGPPSSWLSLEEKKVWRSVAKQVLPGVVTHSDRDAFEMLVRLTYKMRTDFDKMRGAEMGQLVSLFSRFAMTPADRSKVSVSKPKTSAISKYLTPRAPRPVPVTALPSPEPFEPAAPGDLSVNKSSDFQAFPSPCLPGSQKGVSCSSRKCVNPLTEKSANVLVTRVIPFD